MNIKAMNGTMLAFVGDAYYDLKVREMLIRQGINKSNRCHRLAVFYVSANAQSMILHHLIEAQLLFDDELEIVRRGRNVKSKSTPKNTDVIVYRQSTAFEALIGYLYLSGKTDRLDEIIELSVAIRKEDESNE